MKKILSAAAPGRRAVRIPPWASRPTTWPTSISPTSNPTLTPQEKAAIAIAKRVERGAATAA